MQQSSIAEYLAPEAHEQGIQQGIQQGAQETIRENILEALASQLQPEIAETFKSDLEAINDLQRLKQLFRTAMRVETPEDFTQALNENGE
ncbi:MAG: hypothetical protein OXH00_20180, partial [Candidatus Poribacteria bacterium]|nr:hypothetical protein [Candidatus Poribacteria bacterium]